MDNENKGITALKFKLYDIFAVLGIIVLLSVVKFSAFAGVNQGIYSKDMNIVNSISLLNVTINNFSSVFAGQVFEKSGFVLTDLYFWLLKAVFAFTGLNLDALKDISVISSACLVAICYLLFLSITGNRFVVFIGSVFLAFSQWGFIISAQNFTGSIYLCFVMAAFALFITGINTKKYCWLLLSAVLLGVAFYIDFNSLFAFFMLLVFIELIGIFDKPLFAEFSDKGFFYFTGAYVIVILPVLGWLLTTGSVVDFFHKLYNLSLINEMVQSNSLMPFVVTVKAYLNVLFFGNYSVNCYSVPDNTLLDFILSSLFILGLLIAVKNVKLKENLFFVLWFAVGLIMQIVVRGEEGMIPDVFRLAFLLPLICMLAAITLFNLVSIVVKRLSLTPQKERIVFNSAISLVLFVFIIINLDKFLYKYANNMDVLGKCSYNKELVVLNDLKSLSLKQKESIVLLDSSLSGVVDLLKLFKDQYKGDYSLVKSGMFFVTAEDVNKMVVIYVSIAKADFVKEYFKNIKDVIVKDKLNNPVALRIEILKNKSSLLNGFLTEKIGSKTLYSGSLLLENPVNITLLPNRLVDNLIINSNRVGKQDKKVLINLLSGLNGVQYICSSSVQNSECDLKMEGFTKESVVSIQSRFPIVKKYYKDAGLNVLVYNNVDFKGKPLIKGCVNSFNIDFKGLENNYSVIFTGFIKIPETLEYDFFVESDDASFVYIDGKQIINNPGEHPFEGVPAKLLLKSGYHSIMVKYIQYTGSKGLRVRYKQVKDSELKDIALDSLKIKIK